MRAWMKLTGCMVVVVAIGCAKTDYSTGCADDQTTCVDYEGGVDSSAGETSVDSGRDTNIDTRDSSVAEGGDVGDVGETSVDADAGDSRDSCTPITCPATACGSLDDGCGGKITCPDCAGGKTCDTGTHTCVCKPISACPTGLECGNVADGCGGTFACPSCTGGKTCNTTTNKCETTCTPATTCPSGKCGTIDNGCGTGTISCSTTCTSPATCGGGGTANICGCTKTGSCGSRVCGTVADGCGGTITCGTLGGACPSATPTCNASGACVCTPTWSCTGKCGPITDSCGGTQDCGACACATGDKRCTGLTLQTCNATKTGWTDLKTCGVSCSTAGCVDVTSIATGNFHTCAGLSDGTVRCWGGNIDGELGDGTNTNHSKPAAVPGLTAVAKVFAGGEHTCALMTDNTVRCWGDNSLKAAGSSASFYQLTPVPVSISGVAELALGQDFSCARMLDGTVQCWGAPPDGSSTSPTPHTYSPITGAVQLAAESQHLCALISGGSLRCWGKNGGGQLGDGTTTDRIAAPPLCQRS